MNETHPTVVNPLRGRNHRVPVSAGGSSVDARAGGIQPDGWVDLAHLQELRL